MLSEKWQIGDTTIHPIGIGTWAMGGSRMDDGTIFADYQRDLEEAEAIRLAISLGQNHIDTAQLYGAGHTEEIVGEAMRGVDRSGLFLATKVWKSHAASRLSVCRAVEESLRKLGTDYVDLIYTHAPFDGVPMETTILGLNDAVEAGLARSIGVSNYDAAQLKEAVELSPRPIVANQLLYNLLERGLVTPEMLAFCRERGITIVAYRPVERRLLADRAENPTVMEIASRYDRPVAQIAINWLIGMQGVVTIPKAVVQAHIEENLASLEFSLSDEDRLLLDRVNE
jgi:diketogulonate reductase-like aldo/keto reductase